MPTRYSLDVDLKQNVTLDAFKDPSQRIQTRKVIKKAFEERKKKKD
jgi:large subunit ribosomal protein L27e